ncbi:MAG: hypothetical protein HQK67_12395 [Desulfamplus sp.]|nr:hypothetical protein [Desulfamplus sp.]
MSDIKEQNGFLNWEGIEFRGHDMGGASSKVCNVCRSIKIFRHDIGDYGDNTDQKIKCSTCGWKGNRSITYRRSGTCYCHYNQSYLKIFISVSDDIVVNGEIVLNIVCEAGTIELYLYQSHFSCLIISRNNTYSANKLNEIEIDWENKKVMFIFECTQLIGFVSTDNNETLSFGLNFDNAQAFLDKTKLYNHNYPNLGIFAQRLEKVK